MTRRQRFGAGAVATAMLLCVFTACPGPRAPLTTFSLDRYLILQPVLYLDDDRWFEGNAAIVVQENRTGRRAVVLPALTWSLSSGEVIGHLDRLELHTWGVPSRPLVTSTALIAALDDDAGDGLWAFEAPAHESSEVRELRLDRRDHPDTGDVLFVVGCDGSSGTCVQAEHAVRVLEVEQAGFWVAPLNPESTHAYGGSPVVTADGLLVGVFTRLGERGQLRVASVGPLRQYLASGDSL